MSTKVIILVERRSPLRYSSFKQQSIGNNAEAKVELWWSFRALALDVHQHRSMKLKCETGNSSRRKRRARCSCIPPFYPSTTLKHTDLFPYPRADDPNKWPSLVQISCMDLESPTYSVVEIRVHGGVWQEKVEKEASPAEGALRRDWTGCEVKTIQWKRDCSGFRAAWRDLRCFVDSWITGLIYQIQQLKSRWSCWY